jgi:hypothetical protein
MGILEIVSKIERQNTRLSMLYQGNEEKRILLK